MIKYFSKESTGDGTALKIEDPPKKKTGLPCIICGAPLQRGEKMKSEEFKGEERSIVHMYGCPHCHGDTATRVRTCPVCKRDLGRSGYLAGSMWKTKKGKMHLHVSGCNRCASNKVLRKPTR